MSYATYAGDQRSSWERLDWLQPRNREEKSVIPISKLELADRESPAMVLDIILEETVTEAEVRSYTEELQKAITEAQRADEQKRTMEWARVGYVVIACLAVFLIGIVISFVSPKPIPLAVAAMGMTGVLIALWQGGELARH